MTRNLKALGLALIAVFAMSAVAASGASAQDLFTTETGEPAYLHGEQVGEPGNGDNEFNTHGLDVPVTCEEATFETTEPSTIANGTDEVTVGVEYDECEFVETFPAFVDTEDCHFLLTGETHEGIDTDTEMGTGEEDATVSLECGGDGAIEVTVPEIGCTLTMSAAQNQNLLGVTYESDGGDVFVDVTVDQIHYTTNFPCQLGGLPATGEDGYLTQTVTVSGYDGANHDNPVGIAVS